MGATPVRIESMSARAYVIPTDKPEADGTVASPSTTLVVVEASAGGQTGLNYTYADRSITGLISDAVDVQHADATRCGMTGLRQVAALCDAEHYLAA
jgi:hypothetical protein